MKLTIFSMSFENYLTKMKEHKDVINSKISIWKSEKKKGSKGEQITREFLQKYKIDFKEQISFDGLYYKDKNFPLRFDFKVWYNDEWFLLEIDGMQHHQTANFGGKLTERELEQNLHENIERDELKNKWCESHNIRLERILWDGNKNRLVENLTKLFRKSKS